MKFTSHALLIAALSVLLLSSCANDTVSGQPVDETDAQTGSVETEPADMLDARKQLSDNLPDKDFSGRDFHIIVDEYSHSDYIAESEDGGLINDASSAATAAFPSASTSIWSRKTAGIPLFSARPSKTRSLPETIPIS